MKCNINNHLSALEQPCDEHSNVDIYLKQALKCLGRPFEAIEGSEILLKIDISRRKSGWEFCTLCPCPQMTFFENVNNVCKRTKKFCNKIWVFI